MTTPAFANDVLRLIHSHHSIRHFKPQALTDEMVATIVQAAQMASTSSFLQAYTVIHVTDPALRRQLAALAGDQEDVATAGAFLVWCADLHRHKLACEANGTTMESAGVEPFLVASVDTALAAQTAMLAAESMGLGGCYIGGIRNSTGQVAGLLGLPQLVYPVFGMCLGYPDESPLNRPRLPLPAVLHRNKYEAGDLPRRLAEYDALIREYYRTRSGGTLADEAWTARVARLFAGRRRPDLDQVVADQGFRLR